MTVLVRAEFHVTTENRDEFLRLAVALADAASSEPETLQYRWFSSTDPETFVVVEEYTDEAAAVAHTHNRAVGALLEQAAQVSEMTKVDLHGALGTDLEQWIEQHPQASAFAPLTR